MILSNDQISRWLKSARHGETLVYARATFLPAQCAVAERLRGLVDSGHVILYRQRRSHGAGTENFSYVAKRTARPIDDAPPRVVHSAGQTRPGGARRESACAAVAREIMPEVRDMVADGRRNVAAMARALGIYSAAPVRKVLREMERLAA